MKRALILTYYWPPTGGSGVQRWLKFAKYLPELGWQPVIYTPENPESPVIDQTLAGDIPDEAEILKTEIWEPYQIYKKLTGKKDSVNTGFLSEEEKEESLLEYLSVWIRGNLFIPDARKFWIRPSVSYLKMYLREHPVDCIISTGPPHSLHLIAREVKRSTGLPWLADFRDPWTNIDFYEDLHLTNRSDQKHRKLEKSVVDEADVVTVIGSTMKSEFDEIAEHPEKIHVITNGFDHSDFEVEGQQSVLSNDKFHLTHTGTLTPARNPIALWNAIAEVRKTMEEHPKDESISLQLNLVGTVDYQVKAAIEKAGLADITNYVSYVPHKKIPAYLTESDCLLLILNDAPNAKGIVTGKFFEYLASKTPILATGPKDGDVAEILKETDAGAIAETENQDLMAKHLYRIIESKIENKSLFTFKATDRYSRKALTGKLESLLKEITEQEIK